MPLEHIFDNCTGFENRHIAIVQDGDTSERMTGAVRIRFEVLRMEVHAVKLVGQIELLEQPDNSSRAGVGGKMQFQHVIHPSF